MVGIAEEVNWFLQAFSRSSSDSETWMALSAEPSVAILFWHWTVACPQGLCRCEPRSSDITAIPFRLSSLLVCGFYRSRTFRRSWKSWKPELRKPVSKWARLRRWRCCEQNPMTCTRFFWKLKRPQRCVFIGSLPKFNCTLKNFSPNSPWVYILALLRQHQCCLNVHE